MAATSRAAGGWWISPLDTAAAVENHSIRGSPLFMDAMIADIVVVLDRAYEERLPEALEQLKSVGMSIETADDDNSVVTGCIEAHRVEALEKLESVDYVRKVFTYAANFPPGDPRDRDGV